MMLALELETEGSTRTCFRRLDMKMEMTAAGTKSGIEVFRRIVREVDPVTESTEYGLRFSFPQLVFQKCATPTEPIGHQYLMIYIEKTGQYLDDILIQR